MIWKTDTQNYWFSSPTFEIRGQEKKKEKEEKEEKKDKINKKAKRAKTLK